MNIRLPEYIRKKHRIAAAAWGAAVLLTVLFLFLLRTPSALAAESYSDIEKANAGFDKSVILTAGTFQKIRTGASRYTGFYSSQTFGEELYAGFLGDQIVLIKRKSSYPAWDRTADRTVYQIRELKDAGEQIQELLREGESESGLLQSLEPLMLQEYRESAALLFIKVGLWLFLPVALVFFGIHLLPLFLPERSKTGKYFMAYGLSEADAERLDEDKEARDGCYADGGSFISGRYISVSHFTYVFTAPVRSLLWVYPAQVIHSGRGIHISWHLECWFSDGSRQRVGAGDKAEAGKLSIKVRESFPWVLAGFSSALFHRYDGQPEKLGDFRDKAEERQKELSPTAQADVRRSLWGLDEEYQ